jgi:alpha-mannosidase
VAAWVSDAPPYGITTHAIRSGQTPARALNGVVVDGATLRNAHLEVSVNETGQVTVSHASGRRVLDAITFVDEADLGDLYTPAPRARPVELEFRGVRPVHRGPLRGALELRYRVRDTSRRGRTDVDLSLSLVLDAEAPFLRLEVSGNNYRTDHRVRIALRGDVERPTVWADAAFGPVQRVPVAITPDEAAMEHAPPTAPLHRYVSLFDDRRGWTLFSDGLAEYEPRAGEVLVTLLRAVGELSRNDLPERPGHAGWPTPTPGAQCLGPFSASLAVMFHGPRDEMVVDEIERAADDVLLPLTGTTLRSALDPRDEVVGLELLGDGLAFSALKESEDGESLVVRCVNRRDEAVRGAWRFPFNVREARRARLDETPLAPLEHAGTEVHFTAEPHAIVTLLVR